MHARSTSKSASRKAGLGALSMPTEAEWDDDGRTAARALIAWTTNNDSKRRQADRYLLMWYAKTLTAKWDRTSDATRSCVRFIREHLTRDELRVVDRAATGGWETVVRGRSWVVLASRDRKRFLASLTPRDRARYEPILEGSPTLPMAKAVRPPPGPRLRAGIDVRDQEPSDDELVAISREAFAGVPDANRRALAGIHERIEIERARVLARIQARAAARDGIAGSVG